MAVIFMDGFDYYQGGTTGTTFNGDLGKRWSVAPLSSSYLIGPGYARTPGGQGLLVANASAVTMWKSFGANYAQGVVGLAMRVPGSLASKQFLLIGDGTTEQCSIRTNSSGVLTVNQGATVKATGSTVLSSGVWYYLEFKFTAHGSAGVAEVKLNGAAEIASTSSLDLTGTANNYWNALGISSTANSDWWCDDLYALDPTTGANTTFLGPVRVATLYPAAPGNHTDWTSNGGSNMGCVSEPYNDGDGSFNQSATANQIDSFVMQDLPIGSGTVCAVQHVMVARQDAGGPRTLAALNRIASTDYVGTTKSLSTSYQFLTEIFDESPATSSAWTPSEVAGLESGYKILS